MIFVNPLVILFEIGGNIGGIIEEFLSPKIGFYFN